jgi:hypothetical protein
MFFTQKVIFSVFRTNKPYEYTTNDISRTHIATSPLRSMTLPSDRFPVALPFSEIFFLFGKISDGAKKKEHARL